MLQQANSRDGWMESSHTCSPGCQVLACSLIVTPHSGVGMWTAVGMTCRFWWKLGTTSANFPRVYSRGIYLHPGLDWSWWLDRFSWCHLPFKSHFKYCWCIFIGPLITCNMHFDSRGKTRSLSHHGMTKSKWHEEEPVCRRVRWNEVPCVVVSVLFLPLWVICSVAATASWALRELALMGTKDPWETGWVCSAPWSLGHH